MNPLSHPEPWSQVAEGYAAFTSPMFRQYCDRAIDLAQVQPEHLVLDVACGPGTLSLSLQNKAAAIHCIDFSEIMIEELQKNVAQENNITTPITAEIMDGQDLSFPNNMFDRAFSMFGLMFFPDRRQGFSELYRVLKPGGVAVVSSWAPLEHSPLMQLMFGAMGEAFPDAAPPKKVLNLENPDQFQTEMTQAGFQNASISSFDGKWEITHVRDFLDNMIRGSAPIIMLKNQMEPAAWEEKYKIMLAYMNRTLTTLPQTRTSRAYLGVGVKPA